MKKTLLLFILAFTVSIQASFAQSQKIKGRVTDSKGEGVPGASVKVKGTEVGTVTDIDGNYELELPEGKKVLVIDGIAGKAQTEVKDASAPVNVVVEQSSQDLEGVEIYGKKIDKRESVSSISTVTAEQIASRPITNIVSALDGNAAGVNVSSGGGQPGASPDILVRGFGSLSASSSPLIVLDGAVYDGTLSSINPYDVATMSVLKDASATSIYGARGANGVIMITTKKGKKGDKPIINIDAQVGMFTRMIPEYDRVSARDYYKLAWEGLYNIYSEQTDPETAAGAADANTIPLILGGYNTFNVPADQVYKNGQINPNASILYEDDWQKAVSRTGLRQKYNVSVNNGDDKSTYYFSVGYNNEKGIFKQSDYDRITTRLNITSKITPWLNSGLSLGVTYDNMRSFAADGSAYANPFMTTRLMPSLYPIYLHDPNTGALVLDANGQPQYDFGDNPQYGQVRQFATNQNVIASIYNDNTTTKAFSGFGSGYLEAKFLKDFTARTNISVNTYNGNQSIYQNKFFGDGEPFNGILTQQNNNNISYTWTQLLMWKPTFGIFNPDDANHSLDVTVGHENYLLRAESSYLQRAGFGGSSIESGAAAAYGIGSSQSVDYHAIESYFAFAGYTFKQRYTLNATFRRDGTSRFAKDGRWGNFYSVGGNWMLSEESFLKGKTTWIDELKLRASYGITGNENLGSSNYYAYLTTYSYYPNNTYSGYAFGGYGNPALKWESQYSFDVAVDFSLFNKRLTGTADFYQRGSKDLLFVQTLAPSTGVNAIQANVGAVRNTGIELELHGKPVVTKNFSWTIDVTAWHYRNKMTQIQSTTPGQDTIYGSGSILANGLPRDNYFLPDYAGVNPDNGKEQWRLADGTTTTDYNIAQQPQNCVYAGTPYRDIEGSLRNTLNYKGIDFSFMFTFGLGGKFYDGVYQQLAAGGWGTAYSTDLLNRWQKPGDQTDVPKMDYSELSGRTSTRFLTSNSFLNIKNVNLGYTLPDKWLKTAGFRSARVYVQAENIFVFTPRKGQDLQQNFVGGSDYVYPPYRTIMFGLNIGL
ncbi:SusC/RagA family TonB-linked outer membrane protein [Taibaiella helva]|uniref:SusC/RagA family TonB-linked outer membrane protein n=1 Tax=Taibaiella helva TaxID=2301235 RepID=UPI000E594795|nr:SusC/RagA family TonB-linked outer membrane protein [Taibaiella helva]